MLVVAVAARRQDSVAGALKQIPRFRPSPSRGFVAAGDTPLVGFLRHIASPIAAALCCTATRDPASAS